MRPRTLVSVPPAGTWVALAAVLLVNGAFVVNNLAPYLGWNYAGAMTMYSGLTAIGDNHLLMPKVPLGDADSYVRIVRFVARDVETPSARDFGSFASWAEQRRRLVSMNFVRYHAGRVCASAAGARAELVLQTEDRRRLAYPDVCTVPAMLRYAPLTKYPICQPDCKDVLRLWVLGKVPNR